MNEPKRPRRPSAGRRSAAGHRHTRTTSSIFRGVTKHRYTLKHGAVFKLWHSVSGRFQVLDLARSPISVLTGAFWINLQADTPLGGAQNGMPCLLLPGRLLKVLLLPAAQEAPYPEEIVECCAGSHLDPEEAGVPGESLFQLTSEFPCRRLRCFHSQAPACAAKHSAHCS